jgi:hypothetical protein
MAADVHHALHPGTLPPLLRQVNAPGPQLDQRALIEAPLGARLMVDDASPRSPRWRRMREWVLRLMQDDPEAGAGEINRPVHKELNIPLADDNPSAANSRMRTMMARHMADNPEAGVAEINDLVCEELSGMENQAVYYSAMITFSVTEMYNDIHKHELRPRRKR